MVYVTYFPILPFIMHLKNTLSHDIFVSSNHVYKGLILNKSSSIPGRSFTKLLYSQFADHNSTAPCFQSYIKYLFILYGEKFM